MTQYEYRTEVIPLDPGEGRQTNHLLDALGAEGWMLVSAEVLPVVNPGASPVVAANGQPQQPQVVRALLVALCREKAPAAAPQPVPGAHVVLHTGE
jgi:hypothetical protein